MTFPAPMVAGGGGSLVDDLQQSNACSGRHSTIPSAPKDKLRNELLPGTLDLLILRTLANASLHGWDIAKRIGVLSNDRLSLKQGSLYPALHRLEARGWIDAEWGVSVSGRSAKFYRLTGAGRGELEAEKAHWMSFASAVASVLNMEESPMSGPTALTGGTNPNEAVRTD